MRHLFRIALLFTVIVYLVIVLWSLPIVQGEADGLRPLDLRPLGYSGEEARAFLSAITDAGRAQYLGPQRLLDLIYPALLAITLVFGIFRFGGKMSMFWRLLLSVLPMLGAACDYVENELVAAMLKTPVDLVTDEMVQQANFASLGKSGLTTISMLLVVVLAVRFGIKRRKKARRRAAKANAE